jgi:hypothetical protein
VIEEIRASAAAAAERHEATAEAVAGATSAPPPLAAGPPAEAGEARRQAAARTRDQATDLALVVYEETLAACRVFAAQHNMVLELEGRHPEAEDVSELCRAWLRDFWRAAPPPAP